LDITIVNKAYTRKSAVQLQGTESKPAQYSNILVFTGSTSDHVGGGPTDGHTHVSPKNSTLPTH